MQKGGSSAAAFDDWCFGEEDRQAGDSAVVKTTYGYHVMYFVGEDLPKSRAKAYDDLVSERYKAVYDALIEECAVTVNAEAYDTIKA